MYLRHRHRRGAYPLAAERQLPRVARPLLLLAAVILLGFLVRSAFRSWISADAARAGAELFTEDRGTVSVIIEEKEQRAENGMTLLPGETVRTGASARAGLRFFDGTRMRLGEGTELTIDESSKGEQARITLTMKQGTLWMQTPSAVTFSGAVQRVITTPSLTFTVPGGTDAAFTALSLAVFSSEEVGVDTGVEGRDSFVIGEGQQWSVPSGGEIAANPYEHRSPIDSASALSAFAQESRRKMGASSGVPVSSGAAAASELLTVTSPKNGAVNDPVITVQGTIGDGVVSVLINGQPALVDAAKRTFSQQVSPPEGTAEFEITVRALDANKTVLSEIRRAVTRSTAASLNPPTVTTPAKTGQTYRTAREELILRGTSPAGAVGIMVNDYRLQLFDPAKGEWSYIASTRLGNLFSGTNVYDVYAIDAQGRKSAAARLTAPAVRSHPAVAEPCARKASRGLGSWPHRQRMVAPMTAVFRCSYPAVPEAPLLSHCKENPRDRSHTGRVLPMR